MEIESGRELFGLGERNVYSLLPYVEPGLFLDVGAAAGHATRLMLKNSPNSTVTAFEPFPGNLPFFEKTIGDDKRVALHPNAVSNVTGDHDFHVGSIVTGNENGWESMAGYSSLGRIVDGETRTSGQLIQVQAVRIDDVIGDDHIRFMKIDVQGGELSVLSSAQRAIEENRVDLISAEFAGDQGLIEFLEHYNPSVFDSEYLLIPRARRRWFGAKRGIKSSNWSVFNEARLSTGRLAYKAWPTERPTESHEYAKFLQSANRKIGYVQTDLLIVSRNFQSAFELARSRLLAG